MTNKIAIMYDFDETLCTKNMQEYSLIPNLNTDAKTFWSNVGVTAKEGNMDLTLAYMYCIINRAKEVNYPIKRDAFQQLGKDIEYYPGVEEYFARIVEFGKQYNLEVEHFIISSGTKEIIEGCSIYSAFTKVFASEFHYDKNGFADWPALAINYTGKTQFLFRINKNALDIYDNETVNSYIAHDKRDIPFDHMIYLGDGLTDVPCMKLVKGNGGYSIGVYTNEKPATIKRLLDEDRVNFAAKADYREGSQLDTIIKNIIIKIASEDTLKAYNNQIGEIE